MKIRVNRFHKRFVWSLGFEICLDFDTENIVGTPAWIFSLEVYFLKWEYYLEIHSTRSKNG